MRHKSLFLVSHFHIPSSTVFWKTVKIFVIFFSYVIYVRNVRFQNFGDQKSSTAFLIISQFSSRPHPALFIWRYWTANTRKNSFSPSKLFRTFQFYPRRKKCVLNVFIPRTTIFYVDNILNGIFICGVTRFNFFLDFRFDRSFVTAAIHSVLLTCLLRSVIRCANLTPSYLSDVCRLSGNDAWLT